MSYLLNKFLKKVEFESYEDFRENYEGGNLPIYALVEVFSFGTLSKFFKNIFVGIFS